MSGRASKCPSGGKSGKHSISVKKQGNAAGGISIPLVGSLGGKGTSTITICDNCGKVFD